MVLGASTLNMVLSHPDDIDTSEWSSERMIKEIKHQFEGWDSWFVCTLAMIFWKEIADTYSLVALINMMKPNPANWPVFQVRPLPRLTSKSGRFLLMGDAAHAMAFYLSMGEFTSTLNRSLATDRSRRFNGRRRCCSPSGVSLTCH